MLLHQVHQWLGWPEPKQILAPEGAGAKVYVDLARQKIEAALKRRFPGLSVQAGVLSATPESGTTSMPLAIVCQFQRGAQDEHLREAHRLAWNFSRSALLLTLEPHRLMAWTCCRDPEQPPDLLRICELETPGTTKPMASPQQQSVRDLLHWVSLITGHIRRQHPERFSDDGRADRLLLKNLRDIRRRLLASNLKKEFCHDLLARVIFTQFLFHRRDSDGNPFFSQALLQRRCDGALRAVHADFVSILKDKRETYALFRWLDDRFNGDLFPGAEQQTPAEREASWRAERNAVSEAHLRLIADLISGHVDTTDRQLRLWPQYSFDTIPIEFISSVYEEFLNEEKYKNKAFYTPSHLVDYVLDAVLPWDGDEWDVRVADPACGSGVFLVKAFQRLIYRWRRAHDREPLVRDLKPLLANNLYGVDVNRDAVRVASFSLYLAMVDAIEPKHYVTREKVFPRLRDKRLVAKDFFDDATPGLRTHEDATTFDLVIGNPPWGDGSIQATSTSAVSSYRRAPVSPTRRVRRGERTHAERWAKEHKWPVTNNDIGPLFLAKAATLVRPTGRVAMVQPAPPLLYQRGRPAEELRRKLFTTFTFEEVTNLSAIRHELFSGVIGPACVVVFGRQQPSPDSMLAYCAPKPVGNALSGGVSVEAPDVSRVSHGEAASESTVWCALALGGRRDRHLLRKLASLPTLAKLKASGAVLTRMGVIPGDRRKKLPELRGKPYFDEPQFPADVFLTLDTEHIAPWEDPFVDSLHGIASFEEFKQPQLLIKQSYSVERGRFRAALVRSKDPVWGTVCKKTYLSVRDLSADARHIRAACLVYNSLVASYFLALTSGRIGHYITETLTKELMNVPLPTEPIPPLDRLRSFEDIDELARRLFSLTPAETILIDDFLTYVFPDALRKTGRPGERPTTRKASGPTKPETEPELSGYALAFLAVLKSTFGSDKPVSATVYHEPDGARLPVRVVTIHLDWPGREPLRVEAINADGLLDRIGEFHASALHRTSRRSGDSLGFQRVAFLFHAHLAMSTRVRNLTIIKPDECRYWTRSAAMRDADDLTAAILHAANWGRRHQ